MYFVEEQCALALPDWAWADKYGYPTTHKTFILGLRDVISLDGKDLKLTI